MKVNLFHWQEILEGTTENLQVLEVSKLFPFMYFKLRKTNGKIVDITVNTASMTFYCPHLLNLGYIVDKIKNRIT